MKLPILFQSLKPITGQEERSKLLAQESNLYQILAQIKTQIRNRYAVKPDRMDLHIEITKLRQDPEFYFKAKNLHQTFIDISEPQHWGFLRQAFVLWTPEVADYGKTHITLAFFGNYPKPSLSELLKIVEDALTT